jgi:hypothetical protein
MIMHVVRLWQTPDLNRSCLQNRFVHNEGMTEDISFIPNLAI